MRDARIGDLAFSQADNVLWGVRHLNGICTLVRMPPRAVADWFQVVSWLYGTANADDVDVSRDGTRLVASFGEISGQQEVRVFDVAALERKRVRQHARADLGLARPRQDVEHPLLELDVADEPVPDALGGDRRPERPVQFTAEPRLEWTDVHYSHLELRDRMVVVVDVQQIADGLAEVVQVQALRLAEEPEAAEHGVVSTPPTSRISA